MPLPQSTDLAPEPFLLALGTPPKPGLQRRAYLVHTRWPRFVAQLVDMKDLEACQNVDPEADIVALDERYALVGVRLIDGTEGEGTFDWKAACDAVYELLG